MGGVKLMATIPSPRTWTNGEEVLESLLDQELKTNWNFFANPPRVKVYNTTGQTILAAVGTATQDQLLVWDTEVYDTDGMHSTSVNTSRLTCVTGGAYQVILHLNWSLDNQISDATHGPGNKYTSVRLNNAGGVTPTVNQNSYLGTDIAHILPSDGLGPQTSHINFQCNLVAGDYIEAVASTSSFANTVTIVSGQPSRSFFAMRWIGTV
jgi:hypothetical protein